MTREKAKTEKKPEKKPTSSKKQAEPLGDLNEQLVKTPCIQSITQAVKFIGENIEATAVTVQSLVKGQNEQKKETDDKINAVADAVGILNSELTKLVQAIRGGSLPAKPETGEKPVDTGPGSNQGVETPPAQPKPQTLGERALSVADILTRLAGLSQGSQDRGITSTEEGIAKGFDMMMATMGGMAKVMGEWRKGFLEEFKTSLEVAKMVTGKGMGKTRHLEE